MKTTLFSIVLVLSNALFSQDFEKVIDQNLFMLHLSEISFKKAKLELVARFPEGTIIVDDKETFQFQSNDSETYTVFKVDDYSNLMVNFTHSDEEKYDEMLANLSVSDDFELLGYKDIPDYIQANSNWSQFGIQFDPEERTYTIVAVKLNKNEGSNSQLTE